MKLIHCRCGTTIYSHIPHRVIKKLQLKVSFATALWCKWKWQQGITAPINKIASIKKILQLDEFSVNVSSTLTLLFSALAIVLSLTNFPFEDLEHKLINSLSNSLNFFTYIHETNVWILAYISLMDWRDYLLVSFYLSDLCEVPSPLSKASIGDIHVKVMCLNMWLHVESMKSKWEFYSLICLHWKLLLQNSWITL